MPPRHSPITTHDTRHPPVVSRDDVERRVLRAILTLAAQRDQEAVWLKVRSTWPKQFEVMAGLVKQQILRPDRNRKRVGLRAADFDDVHVGPEDYEPVRRRFEPTHDDVADYLTALGWAAKLSARDYDILARVALEWDFRSIGRKWGRHDDWARSRYAAAVLVCWRQANAVAFAAGRDRARRAFAGRA